MNSSNFKENEKSNFAIEWFKDENEKDLPESLRAQFSKLTVKDQINNHSLGNQFLDTHNKQFNNVQAEINSFKILNQIEERKEKEKSYFENFENKISEKTSFAKNPNSSQNFSSNFYNNNNFNNNNNFKYSESAYSNGLQGFNFNNSNSNIASSTCENPHAVNKSSKEIEFSKDFGNPNEKLNQEKNFKFTCRFELLIDNDKEFQVARRLIGSKVTTNK